MASSPVPQSRRRKEDCDLARYLGDHLSGLVWELLERGSVYREGGKAVPVISVAEDGFPHVAMVSCVVGVTPSLVRVPVGAKSSTLQYLRESGKCTLVVVEAGDVFYIKGTVLPETPTMDCHKGLVAVSLSVTGVWSDSERLYQIESGITYAYREDRAQLRLLEAALIEELSR